MGGGVLGMAISVFVDMTDTFSPAVQFQHQYPAPTHNCEQWLSFGQFLGGQCAVPPALFSTACEEQQLSYPTLSTRVGQTVHRVRR